MIAEAFVDTNILIYAAAGYHEAPAKHARAWEIIGAANYGISGQVLAEFFVNAIKKPAVPLTISEAVKWVDSLSTIPVVAIDADLVGEAVACSSRYQISYWDAALIIAAERLEAPILYTEDLNHKQKYNSVTVINPFKNN